MKARIVAFIALVCAIAVPARAENARLPYAALYRIEQIGTELTNQYTNLVLILRIAPTNTAIRPESVQAFVDTKSGKFPVKIGAHGEFTVPLRDDWAAEDAALATDQPKGAMQLDWTLGLAVAAVSNPSSYKSLMQSVKDCEYVQSRMREILPGAAKINLTGLKIFFAPNAADPAVVVHIKSGDQKIPATSDHTVIIPMNSAWMAEDPQVTFSAPPDHQELVGD